jgi:hypothetical protein
MVEARAQAGYEIWAARRILARKGPPDASPVRGVRY